MASGYESPSAQVAPKLSPRRNMVPQTQAKWPNGKVIFILRGVFVIIFILNPESQLTINIEHHLPHGRPNRLMESKPDLPAAAQGVIIAFWSWEKGAAHRGIPSEKDDHMFMLLLSKQKKPIIKIITHSIILFWNFVQQESVPRTKFKQYILNASVPTAVFLNLDKTFTRTFTTTFSFYNKPRTKLTYPFRPSSLSIISTTADSVQQRCIKLDWPSNIILHALLGNIWVQCTQRTNNYGGNKVEKLMFSLR